MSPARSILRKRWLLPLLVLALVPIAELSLRALGVGQPRAPFLKEDGFVRDNPYFGLLAFPRQLARHAPHFRIAPGADTFRVVVLGESAAMGDPAPAFGLARQLEVQLAARLTNEPVEVINAAMTAINSHLVRRIADDLPLLRPDVVVLYMGNNEVLGPFGPGSLFGRPAPAWWVRLQLRARGTRIGQTLIRAADRMSGRESSARRWHGLGLFDERRFGENDPALRGVYRNFDQNLRAILRAADAAGARVVLSTVAVNETMAPFAGDSANAQWRQARALAQQGSNDARAAYRRAVDLDTLRFRADARINDLIRAAAADTGSRLVESALILGADARAFVDHVHLSFAGNHRLAAQIAHAIAPGASVDEAGMARQLGYTPMDEARMLQQIAARMASRPYTEQADHAERLRGIDERLRVLAGQPDLRSEHRDRIDTAHAARPADVELALRRGQWLEEQQRTADAATVYRGVLASVPHHTLAHLSLGRALATLGDVENAARHMELGSPLAASPRAEACAAVGATLADLGRAADAETWLRRALDADPDHLYTLYNLGLLYGRTDRIADSIRTYERLLAIDPSFSEARNNLAALLHRQGRSAEALDHLRRIVREDPGYTAARRNLAAIEARLGVTNAPAP
jgi:tetratricopeptide (TPR) repeat protein